MTVEGPFFFRKLPRDPSEKYHNVFFLFPHQISFVLSIGAFWQKWPWGVLRLELWAYYVCGALYEQCKANGRSFGYPGLHYIHEVLALGHFCSWFFLMFYIPFIVFGLWWKGFSSLAD